jgi:hypothetical protein
MVLCIQYIHTHPHIWRPSPSSTWQSAMLLWDGIISLHILRSHHIMVTRRNYIWPQNGWDWHNKFGILKILVPKYIMALHSLPPEIVHMSMDYMQFAQGALVNTMMNITFEFHKIQENPWPAKWMSRNLFGPIKCLLQGKLCHLLNKYSSKFEIWFGFRTNKISQRTENISYSWLFVYKYDILVTEPP